jgi:riboflavin synthase
MFTGIIECMGQVEEVVPDQSNIVFTISSPISHELKIDQSIAHDGICLTVVERNQQSHKVVAIQETIDRTALAHWKKGHRINLERCMPAHGRFDGHIVQGHVDTTAVVKSVEDLNGSWKFWFEYTPASNHVTVEKGSVTVNGTSLTVVDSLDHSFSVCIIPYTYENTVFSQLKQGDRVNIEFDIVGKYIAKLLQK